MRNYPEWAICARGALAIGAVLVPLNAWESGPVLTALLADCDAKVAVVDGERLALLQEVGTSGAALVVARAEAPGGITALVDLIGTPPDSAALPDAPLPDVDTAPDDLARIFYPPGPRTSDRSGKRV